MIPEKNKKKLTPEEQRISDTLYGFFLGILAPFDADLFQNMIDNNISPFDLGIELDKNSISFIEGLAKKYRDKIDEYVNYDWIMSRMQKRRPDLYGLFTTEKGKAALTKWLQDIKNMLLSVI
ncbi:MAG: hypothetical protein QW578_05745 [Thermoplasmatales archaeon]